MDFKKVRDEAFLFTAEQLRKSVNEDNFVMQSISSIEEIDKATNMLSKRLREWYELYFPEVSRKLTDHEEFARQILGKSRDDLAKELSLENVMGGEFSADDVDAVLSLAKQIVGLFDERKRIESYLEKVMQKYCPNLLYLAGASVGARLLREARSLRRLASIQASTIQLYGAEKALFRHLRTGARPPKHGFIIQHPLVAKAAYKMKGKVARKLADKISLACRVDYFKGEFMADRLLNELEGQFK